MHSTDQREAGRRDALLLMWVTELTSQLDRSELKEEAPSNTAREEWVRAKDHALGKPKGGWAEGRRTAVHVGDGADVPARQVGIEGGGLVEHCARGVMGESEGTSTWQAKGRLGGGTHYTACR